MKIDLELDECHLKIIDALQPFYGNSRSEVIKSVVIRWIEQNIELIEKIKQLNSD